MFCAALALTKLFSPTLRFHVRFSLFMVLAAVTACFRYGLFSLQAKTRRICIGLVRL